MRRQLAEARVRAAQADLIQIEQDGKNLGDDLPVEDQAEAIALLGELDYWSANLGVEGQQ
jgi:hypothetical protein